MADSASASGMSKLRKWLYQLFSYGSLSLFVMVYVYAASKSPFDMRFAKEALTMNALLVLVMTVAAGIYLPTEVGAYWGGLYGTLPSASPKRFAVLLHHFLAHTLPLLAALWLGWHASMKGALPLKAAIAPIVAASVYFSLAPTDEIYAPVRGNKGSLAPPTLALYCLTIWLFYALATGQWNPMGGGPAPALPGAPGAAAAYHPGNAASNFAANYARPPGAAFVPYGGAFAPAAAPQSYTSGATGVSIVTPRGGSGGQ
jgi:hypothetical protein